MNNKENQTIIDTAKVVDTTDPRSTAGTEAIDLLQTRIKRDIKIQEMKNEIRPRKF